MTPRVLGEAPDGTASITLDHQLPISLPLEESIDLTPARRGQAAPSIEWLEAWTWIYTELTSIEQSEQHEGNRRFVLRLLKRLEERDEGIPGYPRVSQFIDRLISSDEADAYRVGKLVDQEERLQLAVWAAASSFQFSRPPSSQRAAIARLGQSELWCLGVRIPVEVHLYRVPRMEPVLNQWRMHAHAVARVGAWLAKEPIGKVYLAGLLHDVGKNLVLRAAVRLRKGADPDPLFVDEIIRKYHSGVGVIMGHHWSLDPELLAVIAFHHNPWKAPSEFLDLCRHLYVADIVARTAGAEWEGLESNGRTILAEMVWLDMDVDMAMDEAHDAFNHFEAIESGIEARIMEREG